MQRKKMILVFAKSYKEEYWKKRSVCSVIISMVIYVRLI